MCSYAKNHGTPMPHVRVVDSVQQNLVNNIRWNSSKNPIGYLCGRSLILYS
jgi:hypothetical protein